MSNGTIGDGVGIDSPSARSNGAGVAGDNDVAINIDDGRSIGTGQVIDAQAFSSDRGRYAGPNATAGGSSQHLPQPMPTRSHYRLSRTEVLKGLANRFVHSTAYIYFYGGMALASLFTVLISLVQDCPGTLFYSLELGINALLIGEVGIRGYAFGKQFWKSTFNIIDLGLVVLCAVTLAVLFFSHDCSPYNRAPDGSPGGNGRSGKGEELLDSLLLILRNAAQLVRLLSVVRRSSSNVTRRVPNIDLDDARHYSLDWDLEEEGLAARQRMADGGDRGARLGVQNNKAARQQSDEQRQLFEYDDDDDEL